MKFVVLANDDQWEILIGTNPNAAWKRVADINELLNQKDANAYFNLQIDSCNEDYSSIESFIFINSVTKTLAEIKASNHVIRMNAWQGFLDKEIWELSGNITPKVSAVLEYLQKKYIALPDEPGFVSARIIAMIINEAYFAKAEKLSSDAEIDIALKLGTNYPYGPFEWSKLIGLKNVYQLLEKLAKTDERYLPASLLKNEINNNK
jgi:3-hydroxybutyryl-CoA dehydrogenase